MPVSDQGILQGRYTLIPRTLVFIVKPGAVLLLKGAPSKRLWAGLYNGLGGHFKRGEDYLTAARRELAEEAGLSVPGLWLCGVVTIDTGQDPGILLFVLRGEVDANAPALSNSSEGEPAWVPLDQIDRFPLVDDLPVLLPRVLAARPGNPPFSARYEYDNNHRLTISFSQEDTQWQK